MGNGKLRRVRYLGFQIPNSKSGINKLPTNIPVPPCQGSEYPAVIIPVLTQHYILLQRNLIYTAVTRGRKLVVMVGTKKALAIGVKNNKTEKRYTYLGQRLRERVVGI